jgi:hypothetical protein
VPPHLPYPPACVLGYLPASHARIGKHLLLLGCYTISLCLQKVVEGERAQRKEVQRKLREVEKALAALANPEWWPGDLPHRCSATPYTAAGCWLALCGLQLSLLQRRWLWLCQGLLASPHLAAATRTAAGARQHMLWAAPPTPSSHIHVRCLASWQPASASLCPCCHP